MAEDMILMENPGKVSKRMVRNMTLGTLGHLGRNRGIARFDLFDAV